MPEGHRNIAVFLDRDGTLNPDPGYIDTPEKLVTFPFTGAAIRHVNESSAKAIVISNQSGIGRGLINEAAIHRVNDHLHSLLRAEGASLDAIYFCPHHPEAERSEYRVACECRKPRPGMLLKAAEDFDVDLKQSTVIGDRYLDVATAHAVGARGILVLTGYGQTEYDRDRHLWPRMPDLIVANVLEGVLSLDEHASEDAEGASEY